VTDTAALTIRALRETDEEQVLSLLEASLAGGPTGSRTADFLRWKHFTNPFGRSIGLVAVDGDRVAGVRLVMRWTFVLDGRRLQAGRMVDTATDPAFRGRGIFRDLTLAALDIARSDTALIFNTPNSSSLPGYLKMGWHEVGTVPTSVRPVHPLRMALGARAALSRADVAPRGSHRSPDLPTASDVLSLHEAGVDDLLSRAYQPARRLHTARDTAYLTWRYAEVPGLDYRAIPVLSGGRLVGLGIGRSRTRGTLQEFTLSEVIHAADDQPTARSVLRAAARDAGADYVATHVAPGTPTAAALVRAGYVTTGRVGLTLTTLPLGDDLPVDPRLSTSWAFTLGDLEVF
jgi:GNAT superfamily N-acetyltransferase